MPNADEEEVLEFLQSEQDAYYQGEFAAFVDHWHHGPEVTRLVSGDLLGTRIHRGWDALRPLFEEGFRRYPQSFDNRAIIRMENVQVQVSGDMAWVSYDQVVNDRPDDMHLAPFSHGIKIVQRFAGRWKLVYFAEVAPGPGREDTPRIALNRNGDIAALNQLAKSRLPTHTGLTISGKRLRARRRSSAAALQSAIDARVSDLSTNLPAGYLSAPVTVVPLGDNDEGRPIFCWVTVDGDRIVVTFDDAVMLRQKLRKSAEIFALSPAQTTLAELLASGHDLADAAEKLGVSINTVRTQVRRMFEKCGTHTQAALLSLLLAVQNPD